MNDKLQELRQLVGIQEVDKEPLDFEFKKSGNKYIGTFEIENQIFDVIVSFYSDLCTFNGCEISFYKVVDGKVVADYTFDTVKLAKVKATIKMGLSKLLRQIDWDVIIFRTYNNHEKRQAHYISSLASIIGTKDYYAETYLWKDTVVYFVIKNSDIHRKRANYQCILDTLKSSKPTDEMELPRLEFCDFEFVC